MKIKIIFSEEIISKKICSKMKELKGENEDNFNYAYFEREVQRKILEYDKVYDAIYNFLLDKYEGYVTPYQSSFLNEKELEKLTIPEKICFLFEDLYNEIKKKLQFIQSINDPNRYLDSETLSILYEISQRGKEFSDRFFPIVINLYVYYADEEKLEFESAMNKALFDICVYNYGTCSFVVDVTNVSLKYLNQILKMKYPEKRCIQDYDFTKLKEQYYNISKHL